MRILLTGISGNLGYEVASECIKKNIEIIPLVRNKISVEELFDVSIFPEIIETDLLSDQKINLSSSVDAIVHCAGIVHFKKAENNNEKMLTKMIELAKCIDAPLYFVSTAFTFRPHNENFVPNNSYEQDKYNCEKLLKNSDIQHSIIKPSVLTGSSTDGSIRNFTGYYSLLKGLLQYADISSNNGIKLRVPRFTGYSDIVPIDLVAQEIVGMVKSHTLNELYLTNMNPPKAMWLFSETLDYFNLSEVVSMVDMSFDQFGKLKLTKEEKEFREFSQHFLPYWELGYNFPNSALKNASVDRTYLKKILDYFILHN